ncbi:tyrosine--tRNA ligase [Candidatus Peregrinibacteria bacterium]|nr:tyrosine--tRNA ligase [Candidatus Peregrinibacteria bacterium]
MQNKINSTLEFFNRIVDWDSSLTERKEFEKLLKSGKQLRIKFGADITAQTLHLGHGVNLRAMRALQDLGHKVCFLLGGFTTLVGDPTGRLVARTQSSNLEIEKNKKNFIDQVKMILRFDEEALEIHDNTNWFGTPDQHGTVTLGGFFQLLGKVTHSQLVSRDMFKKRIEENKPIMMSEFLYPILQGYDSVELDSDLTIIGSDQMFNEKMAWIYQEAAGQEKQAILCTKITLGLDGKNKQSKSIGNYVGLSHSAQEKYNRTMLLPDNLIPQWFEVYTNCEQAELDDVKANWQSDPIKYKQRLAWLIVKQFHGEAAASHAQKEYLEKRSKLELSSEVPEFNIPTDAEPTVLKALTIATGQPAKMIRDILKQNGVKIVELHSDGQYELKEIPDKYPGTIIENGTILKFGRNKWFKFIIE